MIRFRAVILTILFSLLAVNPFADSVERSDTAGNKVSVITTKDKKLVYYFEINQDIFPAAWRIVKKAVEEAEKLHADIIFIQMNTYGGMVNIADSIRTKLLNTGITKIIFINKNAASAGALISM